MSALRQVDQLVSVKEYLAAEDLSSTKNEYLGGVIRAMGGASSSHVRLSANLCMVVQSQLEGKRCEFFGTDMKLRFQFQERTYYYYPDGMVACDPKDDGNGFRERPTVVFEITSGSTRHVDEGEKRRDYHRLPSVHAYVRIEQDRPELNVERRTANSWEIQRFVGLEAVIDFSRLGFDLPLSRLYARVIFPA